MIAAFHSRLTLLASAIVFFIACQDKPKNTDSNQNEATVSETSENSTSATIDSDGDSSRCFNFKSAAFTIKQYNFKGELNETVNVVTSNFGNVMRQDRTRHVTSFRDETKNNTTYKNGEVYKFLTNKGEQYANTTVPDALFYMEAPSPPSVLDWGRRYCHLERSLSGNNAFHHTQQEYLGVLCDVFTNEKVQKEVWYYKGLKMKNIYVNSQGYEMKELVTKFQEGVNLDDEVLYPPDDPEDIVPLEDDTEKDPCKFPDLSGIWVCEGKGHFELRQTNEEIDGDCISYIEGKYIKYNCTDDLWTLSQNAESYVRGKIVNGEYKLEIFPQKGKENIGYSRIMTELSGTVEFGAESLDPKMLFGLAQVAPVQSVVTDPHNGEKVIQMEWAGAPIDLKKNKCEFKKSSIYALQEPGKPPCNKCKKQDLDDGLSFNDNTFIVSDADELIDSKEASNPLYAVGSGVSHGSEFTDFHFNADFMNSLTNLVPRYNVRIKKVVRNGRYIDVFWEVCDWKTGKKIKGQKTHHMTDLTEEQLNLPDDSHVIQKEYRKAGILLYRFEISKIR